MVEQQELLIAEESVPAPLPPRPQMSRRTVLAVAVVAVLVVFAVCLIVFWPKKPPESESEQDQSGVVIPDWIDQQIIEINGAGRRGEELEAVNNIVIHYVGNPGTSAQNNRNYFNQANTTVSSHFLVGLDGEVILCVPLNEKSSATNDRNRDTISIEVCHPDATGEFNDKTYTSLVRLCAWLCEEFDLSADDLIRHYDVTGKLCPLYYVEHPDAWEQLVQDVEALL